MINITNKRARRLYQMEFERRMNVVENTFFKELRPLLGRQFFNAARLVQQGVGIEGVNHAVDLGRRRLINIFQKHYKRCATVFSRRAYQIFEESIKSIGPSETKTPKDEFWSSISRWSKIEGAKKIRGIQNTTKNVISRVIRKGMEEGESSVNIAKRIRKTSAAINPHRSKTIALTETHGAAVKSVDSAVASTRIEMEREWISAKDDRTRTRGKRNRFEHFRSFPNGADGERVAQDGKFTGTGEALDYPGDSKGSAGNVIRCRCVLIYHTVKRMEQLKPHEPEEDNLFNIEKTESEIAGKKVEQAAVFSSAGKMLFKKTGKKSSITFTKEELSQMKGGILTHNHPSGSGFSKTDIDLATIRGLKTIRAVNKENNVLYSFEIKKPEKYFENKLLNDNILKRYKSIEKHVRKLIEIKIIGKKITPEAADLIHHHEIMKRLVKEKEFDKQFIYKRKIGIF